MYNCAKKDDDYLEVNMHNHNDDNKVASKKILAMNLALDEHSVSTLHEFENCKEDIEFSDNLIHYKVYVSSYISSHGISFLQFTDETMFIYSILASKVSLGNVLEYFCIL